MRKKSRWGMLVAVGVAFVVSVIATFATYLGLILGGVTAQAVAITFFGSSLVLFSAAGVGLIFGAVMLVSLVVALASAAYIQSRETKKFEVEYRNYGSVILACNRDLDRHIRTLASQLQIHGWSANIKTVIETMEKRLHSDTISLESLKLKLQECGLLQTETLAGITSLSALSDCLENILGQQAPAALADTVLLASQGGLFGSASSSSMGLPQSDSLIGSEVLDDPEKEHGLNDGSISI